MALAPASSGRAIAFLLATALTIHWLRKTPPSTDRLVRSVLLVTVIVGLLVPSAVGLLQSAHAVLDQLTSASPYLVRSDVVAIALVLALLVLAARRWPEAWLDSPFLLVVGVAVILLKLAYVQAVGMEPYSDFAEMWSMASRVVGGGLGHAFADPRNLMEATYLERIVPYLLPLRWLFGPEPSAYGIPNVLTGTVCSVLVYALTRDWFGRSAARAAFVVSLVAVETWLAAEIPTHDIPGALYAIAGVALYVRLSRLMDAHRIAPALIVSLLLGLVTLLLEQQRNTGLLMLASGGLLGASTPLLDGREVTPLGRRAVAATTLFLVIPLTVFLLGKGVLIAARLAVPTQTLEPVRAMNLAACTESWSDGSWGHIHQNYELRYGAQPIHWQRLAVVRFASDTLHSPLARLSSYLRKARILFDLGSQTYFYVTNASLPGQRTIDVAMEQRVLLVSRCFTIFFLTSFLLGCRRFVRLRAVPIMVWLPLFYLSMVSTLLILLGPVQPRYLFQLWYLGAGYAGLWLGGGQTTREGQATVSRALITKWL